MHEIDQRSAEALIDFSGGDKNLDALASLQMQGTVALHNMLARQAMAYLADEVGMGKTYIALGVVALMRHFKPDLRVLYLLPKNNVRDKWDKDYRSFIEKNFKLQDLCVKGIDDRPAPGSAICRSLKALIRSVATDSVQDYFICTSAFSFPLGNTAAELRKSLEDLCALLPQSRPLAEPLLAKIAHANNEKNTLLSPLKEEIKNCWATALNAIFPRFDLVVVDEAHNFKRNPRSSDRNQLLAAVLGADNPAHCKASRLLLLSATPFDRDITHLHNQLTLFGKQGLLQINNQSTQQETESALEKFMVRRLNSIELGGCRHTRNMYRDEHRSGARAEVSLKLEQQLFAALLQKKVSEALQENCSGRFELGMLSSFESYLPGEKGKPIKFDGDDDKPANGGERDARDRNIVEYLVADYQLHFENKTPPHPKMDAVAAQAHHSSFDLGKKQLIFVRRVRSVTELKFKIEHAYNDWLEKYLANDASVSHWFAQYKKLKRELVHSLDDSDDSDDSGAGDDTAAASPLSFFSWFYRGTNTVLQADTGDQAGLGTMPDNFRKMLNGNSIMFETNWASLPGMPPATALKIDWAYGLQHKETGNVTRQQRFKQAQFAYLHAVAGTGDTPAHTLAQRILDVAFAGYTASFKLSDPGVLALDLALPTFWNRLGEIDVLAGLQPAWDETAFTYMAGADNKAAQQYIKRFLIHHELIGVVCRSDHPFIDLYALRNQHKQAEGEKSDQTLINAFAGLLAGQHAQPGFCSFGVLRDITATLDLLIKQNFQDAYDKPANELTRYLASQLNPLAPVVGASGENSGSRSAIARKFRMPGYPRVLISTDVFQEGEDLHTFCDQVIHYGISASPIALEQKVGRVDRIASLSHRALRANAKNHQAHFIQVSFPHIKESLEFFQVRQAAANLNQFHRKLHTIGHVIEAATDVDIRANLLDPSVIEGQIRAELFSPYEAKQADLVGENRVEQIRLEQDAVIHRVRHAQECVETCMSSELGSAVRLSETGEGLTWHSSAPPEIKLALRSARGQRELLFSVSCTIEPAFDTSKLMDGAGLAALQALQTNPRTRLQLFGPPDQPIGKLAHNAEVYAGGHGILADSEVQDTYWRVRQPDASQNNIPSPPAPELENMIQSLCGKHIAYQLTQAAHGWLQYSFELENRVQRVQWRKLGHYLLVSSQVLTADQTGVVSMESLIDATLRRNAQFDIVDFHINNSNELAVRAMHPLADLDQAELAFITHMVAIEADRLQYILLNGADDDDDGKSTSRPQSTSSRPNLI